MAKKPDINNYLSDAGRTRRRRRQAFLFSGLFFLAALFFIGTSFLVLRTGLFRAREINITGNKNTSSEAIMDALYSQVFRGHYLSHLMSFQNILIWPDELPQVGIFLPQLRALYVEKNYWRKTITVRVIEREPYGIWCLSSETQECFWFDEDGTIFKKGLASEGSLIRIVNDASGRDIGLGSMVLEGEAFVDLRTIFDVLSQSGIGVKSLEVEDLLFQEAKVKTTDGPNLYFSLRFPATNTLPILRSLKNRSGFAKLGYVDFRVQNRAYYK